MGFNPERRLPKKGFTRASLIRLNWGRKDRSIDIGLRPIYAA